MRSTLRSCLAFALVALPLLQGCTSQTSDTEETSGTDSALSAHANTVSFDDFAKAIDQSNMTQDMGGDCSFTSTKTAGGLELSLTSSGTTVKVSIAKSDRITLKTKNEQSTYTIAGVGSVEILNADDAFDRVTLSSKAKSAACEVDF